jgi:hypothetical protein
MSLLGASHMEKTELEIIKLQAEVIERLTRKDHEPHKVRLILTRNINNSIYQIMNANLAANQQQAFTFALQDTTNPAVTPTGTFTNGAVVSDTPGVATGNVDASGNVNFVAVAPGTANLTASALAAYTDSLGNAQSSQLSTDPVLVTVTAVVTADGVKLVLIPGPITTQPPATAAKA